MKENQNARPQGLIPPYGGRLVGLVVKSEKRSDLVQRANGLQSIQLSPRSLCDLELLATGAFSPLDRFMGERDYRRVLEEMRLSDGTLFPIPITLPVAEEAALRLGEEVVLRSPKNELIALMTVEELFRWVPDEEARCVLCTSDRQHPLVAEMQSWGRLYVSGSIKVLRLPVHHDFTVLRRSPAEVRREMGAMGYANVMALQTRDVLHRVHEELTKRAAERINGALLLHPMVGLPQPGDVEHYARMRCCKVLVEEYYDLSRTVLNLLPLATRMAGPREAVWHAIIQRNFGANYFLIGRNHAGPGRDSTGKPFYGPYEAQELLARFEFEIGVKAIISEELVYLPDEDRYVGIHQVPVGARAQTVSETDFNVRDWTQVPTWAMRPEAVAILSRAFPPRHEQGFCIWFTGLSGSGKSTTAEALAILLLAHGRQVTLLDGDAVRTNLSKGLGFSREDRDSNIRRIGFVAAEIVRHYGVAICAAVSPYQATRNEVRAKVGADQFIMVYMDTPLEICEQRDAKGLYAGARRGEITHFTGVSDPYEVPEDPEIVLTTTGRSPNENARQILKYLMRRGFLDWSKEDGGEE